MFNCEFFTRNEFELAFDGLLKDGDQTAIAGGIGSKPSTVSKHFNPNGITPTLLYRAACILAAWVKHTPGRGRLALRTFTNFVERALPNHDATPEGRILRLVEDMEPLVIELKKTAGEVRDEQLPLLRLAMREVVAEHLAKKGKVG